MRPLKITASTIRQGRETVITCVTDKILHFLGLYCTLQCDSWAVLNILDAKH